MDDDRDETSAGSPNAEVTVRLFAAARDAFGARELRVPVGPGATAATVRERLSAHSAEAARVLTHCTLLVSGRRAEEDEPVGAGEVVDVLPPFAGG